MTRIQTIDMFKKLADEDEAWEATRKNKKLGHYKKCNCCGLETRTTMLSNIRQWPGTDFWIGECECHNTLMFKSDQLSEQFLYEDELKKWRERR